MQTLDCCELCRLVRDKIIISSPSRPNPQAACRIMIRAVLSHLLCIALGTGHSQPSRAAGTALGAGSTGPTTSWKAHLEWSTICPTAGLQPPLLPLSTQEALPSLPVTVGKGWGFQSLMEWLMASWALICGYREVSLAPGALPGSVCLRSYCSTSRLPDNLIVTSPGGCSKSGAIFTRRAGTCKKIKFAKSVQCTETPA